MAFQSILDPTVEQVLNSMEYTYVTSEGRLIVDLNKVYDEISAKIGPPRPGSRADAAFAEITGRKRNGFANETD